MRFKIVNSEIKTTATAQLRAITKLRKRVRANDRCGVVQVAAGWAEQDKAARFVSPCNLYGVASFVMNKTMQAAADAALMHHTAATVYEIAADRTITAHVVEHA